MAGDLRQQTTVASDLRFRKPESLFCPSQDKSLTPLFDAGSLTASPFDATLLREHSHTTLTVLRSQTPRPYRSVHGRF
jgi:hypothetical protein